MTTNRSASVPSPLLGPLVAAGVWSPERALRAARARSGSGVRARALTALAPHLDAEHRRRALHRAVDVVLAVENEEGRASALAGLAPHLDADQRRRVLTRAVADARAATGDGYRARTLVDLAPHLDGAALTEAMRLVWAVDDAGLRAWALAALLPRLDTGSRRRALVRAVGPLEY